jgi:outer membrane murein-binding lipoprotein Lpp
MKKAILFAAIVSFTFAACGGNETQTTETSTDSTQVQSDSTKVQADSTATDTTATK